MPSAWKNRLSKVTLVYSINYRFRKFYYSLSMELWKIVKNGRQMRDIFNMCAVSTLHFTCKKYEGNTHIVIDNALEKFKGIFHFVWFCWQFCERSTKPSVISQPTTFPSPAQLLAHVHLLCKNLFQVKWRSNGRDDIMTESGSNFKYYTKTPYPSLFILF